MARESHRADTPASEPTPLKPPDDPDDKQTAVQMVLDEREKLRKALYGGDTAPETPPGAASALDDFAKWCDERGVGKTEYPYPVVGRLAEYRAWALPRPAAAAIRSRGAGTGRGDRA